MSKNTFFTGQPVFLQLLSFIDRPLIDRLTAKHQTDRYCKSFYTRDHLVTMLFTVFQQCGSLREVVYGLQAWMDRLQHLGFNKFPCRSTLADANERRTHVFFEEMYHQLYHRYYPFLPDSRKKKGLEERMFIIDSTTIELFSDIMEGLGAKPLNGKRKGGAKAHVLMNVAQDIPMFVCISHGKENDRLIMNKIYLPEKSILIFDKGYVNYAQWNKWKKQKIDWVTRLNRNAFFVVKENYQVSDKNLQAGVLKDQSIELGRGTNAATEIIPARLITYKDKTTKQVFQFVTSNMHFSPLQIAEFYKKRWQIELLFKRLKQSYPLRYFLGDNENAIRIQIWCVLISDLLIKIIKDNITRKRWSYANLVSVIRIHLGTYIDIFAFLNTPKIELAYKKIRISNQLKLFFNNT